MKDREVHIELPTPTPWPMVAACALVLIFAGLVTSWVVSSAGLVCAIVAFTGWFLEVFPYPQHEMVPINEESPAQIRVTGRTIAYLKRGQGEYRSVPMHLQTTYHTYSSGILGGIIGGAAMALVALIFGLLEGSIWYPINLVAASGLPNLWAEDKEVLMQFHLLAFLVSSTIHAAFSILIGILYVVLLPTVQGQCKWLYGGVVAPLIWSSLVYAFLNTINPAFALYVSWPWFCLSQMVFGLVVGSVVHRSARMEAMQSWSFADKMGVEGIRKGK